MGNVLFRSTLNLCRTVYSVEAMKRGDGSYGFTSAELEAGAISICKALGGKYKDVHGRVTKVTPGSQ